ncbi:putative D,D-dipeptide transport system permease protein DdpC [Paraburkholderia nemoris]|uniref:ABC transporter permease n=1 Tax=Paraburkholderia nemoris TaxID=2793076 RepID=UPI00190A569D|nr:MULTISPECIES: ABC transporter permease [Paraburkholderia]MBK3786560.1 ABC transporter permease [Paraburkholderia aspalathi]CAE6857739.1 putative D,D-dipeptide transport system permease protein DdpC [Paraburkholderia nemoris]
MAVVSTVFARNVSLLVRRRTVALGFLVLATIVVLAVFAPLVTPYSPNKLSIIHRLQPIGPQHWFGTDGFGRDVFSRTIYAGRLSLLVGGAVVVAASMLGVGLGLFSGFFRRLDPILSRLVDAMMSFPDILLAVAVVAALGPSLAAVIVALSIVYAPRMARVVRASTLVISELPYVEAARALGVSTSRIMTRHILRNLVSPILVQATFIFANAMLAEAGLSFLGLGVDPSVPTWGTMLADGRQYVGQADWLTLFPGIAILLAVLSLQLIGDGLRDLMDPRLKKDI